MNQTQLAPETTDTNLSGRWMTVIFNDDHTPMDLVVLTIMVATRCDATEAEIETWEAHHYGKAPIHFSSESECHQVASVLQSIGVKTEVCLEWED
jgi:ATP-dependent Clp protease adapter protein ClpS